MTLRITKGAHREIAGITFGLAVHNRRAAQRFVEGLDRAMRQLRQHPLTGVSRPELGSDVRMLALRPYQHVLLYTVAGNDVEVAHVLDGRRNLKAILDDA